MTSLHTWVKGEVELRWLRLVVHETKGQWWHPWKCFFFLYGVEWHFWLVCKAVSLEHYFCWLFKSISWDSGDWRDLESLDCLHGKPKLWQFNSIVPWFISLVTLFLASILNLLKLTFLGNLFRGWKTYLFFNFLFIHLCSIVSLLDFNACLSCSFSAFEIYRHCRDWCLLCFSIKLEAPALDN